MKIGACIGTDVERMIICKEIGYDYVETNCGGIANADDKLLEDMKNVGIPILAANCFIGLRVVGPEKDFEKIDEYLGRLFKNASYLGLETLVFGSSGSRKRKDEEGLTKEECREQVVEFLRDHVAPLAEKYNLMIAIEPLRPAECNIINTVADGVEIAKKTGSNRIRVLCDIKHMYTQDEPMSEIERNKDWLIHAHTSNPRNKIDGDRVYPGYDDEFNQDDFMLPLIEIGVEKCSVEAGCDNYAEEAKIGFEVLKKYR